MGDYNHFEFQLRIIEDLILIIDKEIKDELTVDYLSKLVGYSEGHLRRLFKSKKGVSLASYIRRRKIEFAASELVIGSRFIVDIAVEYNFSSQSSFCRTFKSIVGVTPKEYRV